MELFYQDQDQAAPLYRQKNIHKIQRRLPLPSIEPTVIFLMAIWFILLITTHYLHNHMPLIKDCLQTTGNFPKYVPSCYTVQLSHVDICSDRKVPSKRRCYHVPTTFTHYGTFNIFGKRMDFDSTLLWYWQKKYFYHLPFILLWVFWINSKKSIFGPIVPSHQFLTELHWDQRADSLWRLMVRKRSQIASFSLLHYLLLLSKTVLLMTSVHKSNLEHTGNKCSSEGFFFFFEWYQVQKIIPSMKTSDIVRERRW